MGSSWTFRRALFYLSVSPCVTLVLFLTGYGLWSRWQQSRVQDSAYRITAIVQTGPEREALKTEYLAELLGLSVGRETNLYAFDLKKGEEKLLLSPLIAKATIRRLPPHALYIDYEVRRPIAKLGDYHNVGIDREGRLFPMVPFMPPKEFSEIYLGLPSFGAEEDAMGRRGGSWNEAVENRYFRLALDFLRVFEGSPWKEGLCIKRIDVSHAFAPSLGKREIVILTEEEITMSHEGKTLCYVFPKILRLGSCGYEEQIANFFSLQKSMRENYRKQLAALSQSGRFCPRVIDLRMRKLAFVENSRDN